MTEKPSSQRPVAVIAGGSGFIGLRLAAELGGSGWDIVVLGRSPERQDVGPVRFVHWQGKAPEPGDDWPAHLEGARAVINLCGESIGGPRWTEKRKVRLIESRAEPTRALVAAVNACERPPEVFIQASGVGYYGTGNDPFDETGEPGSDFLARLAVQWEAPLNDLRDDVRPVIARFGVVLGSRGGALAQMLMPFRLFVGGPIASGNQWLSWIHLHDAVSAIVWLIEHTEARGVFNVTAPTAVRNAEFAQTAGAALKRPTWMFTPRVLLNLMLGEQATLVCDGQNAVPDRLVTGGFEYTYPTIESALNNLL
jgi:uncharacterized protein (TIGR01777 family)